MRGEDEMTESLFRPKAWLLPALVAAALGGSPAGADPGPKCTLATPTAEAECGTITMVIGARTTSLDPTFGGPSTDYQPMYPQQGLLYRYDINLVPRMDLIEAETVSPDGRTITQKVRRGAKYSDGTPVLAEDAVFAYGRWKAAGHSSAFIAPIVGATAEGDDTIVWTLSAPYPDFRHAIASHFLGIHPKKQVEAKTPAEYFKKPLSAGPLMLAEWTPGTDLMVLRANPQYWAKPHVQELRIVVIPDPTSRLLALQQGSVDYVYTLPLNAAARVDAAKVTIINHAEPGTFMLAVNNYQGQPNEALKDRKVRQAMSRVIDRKRLAEIGFFGIPEPACAYAFKPGNPYHQCSLPEDGRPNLAAAKSLLAETKWPSGFAFEMIVPARPQWAEAAQVVAADLAKIGINAAVKPLPDADITTRIRARNYELVFFRNAVQTPILQLRNWFFPGGAWVVNSGFNDPAAAALLAEAGSSSDPAKIKDLLRRLELLAVEDSSYIPLTSQFSLSGIRHARGVVEAVRPGEYLFVKTTPALPGG
jgi:peptide/nickel transport system substrate-binding protein